MATKQKTDDNVVSIQERHQFIENVRRSAEFLIEAGYVPVPLTENTKRGIPGWQEQVGLHNVHQKFPPNERRNLGVRTGLLDPNSETNASLVAIDIDTEDQQLRDRIIAAIGRSDMPMKKGSKGVTLFVRSNIRMPSTQHPRGNRNKFGARPEGLLLVDILADGKQTVLPPSIHPNKYPYVWVSDKKLWEVFYQDLPLINYSAIDEIMMASERPDSELFNLNEMVYIREGGGGIHNTVLSAVGIMVERRRHAHNKGMDVWTEDDIWARIDRATRAAHERGTGAGSDYEDIWRTWEREVRDMVKGAVAKGFDQEQEGGDAKKKLSRVMSNWYIESIGGQQNLWARSGGQTLLYRDGWWAEIDETGDQRIRNALMDKFTMVGSTEIEQALKTIKADARAFEATKEHKICLTNGTYNLDTDTLEEWKPDDRLISRLTFGYDAQATCPNYESFLRQTFYPVRGERWQWPDDQKELLYQQSVDLFEEFLGYSLIEDYQFQKFLIILGPPASGKSTMTKLMTAFHDRSAVSNVSLHMFDDARYRAAMVGKLLNISGEVAVTNNIADDILKGITSGDEIAVRVLYKNVERTRITARLIVTCNEMFRTRDTSGAIQRRMLVLTCDNSRLDDTEQDTKLIDKLISEMPGIFNRIIHATRRLYARGHFMPTAAQKQEISDFTIHNDSVLAWMQERTTKDGETLNSFLYADYVEWCKMNGLKPKSSISWGMSAKAHGYEALVKWVGGKAVKIRKMSLTGENLSTQVHLSQEI